MNGNRRNHPRLPGRRRAGGAAQAPGHSIMPGAGMHLVMDQFVDADSLYALRAAVAAKASELGMPQPRVYDLITVVHELAANSVRHGGGHGRVQLWQDASILICQVTDDGPPPPQDSGGRAAARAQSREAAPAPSERGHGLWLIGQLTQDEVVLRFGPGGTTATVSFTFRRRQSAPGA
jgi:anti-sigma regulatory factor (Ser/Thr protein kinase)